MTIPIRPTLIFLALLPWEGVIAGPLETITVTGVSAQKEDAGTLDVVTLERRQIEQLHKESLADLLRTIPGVLVNVQGGVGGNTDISIRGAEPNFVAVYIDDIRVNDPVNARGSAFNFNSVNVKAIERIEVVRGPASTLYGSGAIAGVIRITTAADTPSQSLATDIDQDGNYRYGYRLADSTGPWEYSFGLAQNDFLNDKNRNRYDSSEATLGLAYRYSGKGQLYTKFRAMEDEQESYPEQSGGVESAAMDKLDETNSSERMGSIGWNHTVTPIWESSLQASYFHRTGSQASPGIVPFTQVPPNRERINYSDTSLRWNNRVSLLPHLQLQAGFDANREQGESHGVIDVGFPMPVSYRHERDSHGVVLGLDWTSENGWLLQGLFVTTSPMRITARLPVRRVLSLRHSRKYCLFPPTGERVSSCQDSQPWLTHWWETPC
jgi:vitamin B12 transporter